MTTTPPDPESPPRTLARETRGRWPGLVWAVPLAALLIVAFLGLRALSQPGVEAVITFDGAAGARPGDTKVIYRGLEVGQVSRVDLAADGRKVEVTVRLKSSARPLLRSGTVFWLEGAKPSLADLDSVKAALMGVTIGVAPGTGAAGARRFVGLDDRPPILPGARGTAYALTTDDAASLRVGSNVIYHGLEVGKITGIDQGRDGRVRVGFFVRSPWDADMRAGSLFWAAAPLRVSLSGDVLGAQINAAAALGAVAFETPDADMTRPRSPAGAVYQLYPDRGHAEAGGDGPQVLYQAEFGDGAGDLAVGAPVTLGGFAIGSVKSVEMTLDPDTGLITNPVVLALEPRRLNLTGQAPAGGDWRPLVDRAVGHLLARGYRARLGQNPPLVGARLVTLERVGGGRGAGARPGRLLAGGTYPGLPTAPSGDLGAISDKATTFLDTLNAVPIEAIGVNVRRLTGRLAGILASPKVDESLGRLDDTLGQLDAMVRETRPRIGPLAAKLSQAADQLQQTAASADALLSGQGAAQDSSLPDAVRELTNAARSLRALSDYVQRHPESVIAGKARPAR